MGLAGPGMDAQAPCRMNFLSLPPEIRNMIYHIVLILDDYIDITSPQRKTKKRRFPLIGLLQVNKLIHDESTPVYYSINRFMIGNLDWGSRWGVNLHALKALISRVPSTYISSITQIQVEICTRRRWRELDLAHLPFRHYGVDLREVQTLAREVSRRFTGLKWLLVAWNFESCRPNDIPRLPKGVAESVLLKLVSVVRQLPKATEFIFATSEKILDTDAVTDRVVKELEANGKKVKVQFIPAPKKRVLGYAQVPQVPEEVVLSW